MQTDLRPKRCSSLIWLVVISFSLTRPSTRSSVSSTPFLPVSAAFRLPQGLGSFTLSYRLPCLELPLLLHCQVHWGPSHPVLGSLKSIRLLVTPSLDEPKPPSSSHHSLDLLLFVSARGWSLTRRVVCVCTWRATQTPEARLLLESQSHAGKPE